MPQPIASTSLPLYLTTRSRKNDDLSIEYVQEYEQEQGNGRDRNFDCKEREYLNRTAEDVKKFCLIAEVKEDDDDRVTIDNERNYIIIYEGIARDEDGSVTNIARIPDDWKMSEADTRKKSFFR